MYASLEKPKGTQELKKKAAYGGNSEDTLQRKIIQRKGIRGGGLNGTVNYAMTSIDGDTVAGKMTAKKIALKPSGGKLSPEDPPQTSVAGWEDLQTLGFTANPPRYKRMHFLNGLLGGNGKDLGNLAPGSSKMNKTHQTKVEDPIKKEVLKGNTVDYSVDATYKQSSSRPKLKPPHKGAYIYTLANLKCVYDVNGTGSKTIDVKEVPATAAKWPQ